MNERLNSSSFIPKSNKEHGDSLPLLLFELLIIHLEVNKRLLVISPVSNAIITVISGLIRFRSNDYT